MSNVQFKISSALKTIIGKELITDNFIAVFELVKNSFDAQASRVDITFNLREDEEPSIIIQDNGDGMNRDDIINKWLFVAYSSKNQKANTDYRDKISSKRVFAGAKGIGRFSCDRLGSKLRLSTKKKGEKVWHVLEVDWNDFETDPEKEFQNISAEYLEKEFLPFVVTSGTVIEITGLRNDEWSRDKLLHLRSSLERLINPNQENDPNNFQIFLHVPSELEEDERIINEAHDNDETLNEWEIVNGQIKNFLLENLGLKTTQILLSVDSAGDTITTTLTDRGIKIYELVESNPFPVTLKDIKIHLFALNRSSKYLFSRRMGVRPAAYGSVFLYKNGFRIHPFGNPDDDQLGIDRRHQKGVFRTLGTRDISGRIEINGINSDFQETSSRDGGLIRNRAFFDLKDLLLEYALRRLEAFFIDIAKFGTEKGELPDPSRMSSDQVKQAIFNIINKQLTRSENVIKIDYDPNFLNILENHSAESVSALLKNLKKIASKQESSHMTKEVEKAERQLRQLARAKEEAELAETKERERAKKAEAEARESQERAFVAEEEARRSAAEAASAKYHQEQTDTQNIFLKAALSKDLEHVMSLHHSIGQDALAIDNYVSEILALFKDGNSPRPEEIRVALERISYITKKISTITRFATQANHRAAKREISGDLIEYIREYLLNIYLGVVFDQDSNPIPIHFDQSSCSIFSTKFSPIKISMIFDNLISNSRKHRTQKIQVSIISCDNNSLTISFADDGVGIPKKNLPHLFSLGFSTTEGSGLGLYHIRELVSELKGTIRVVEDKKDGAEFILNFPQQ